MRSAATGWVGSLASSSEIDSDLVGTRSIPLTTSGCEPLRLRRISLRLRPGRVPPVTAAAELDLERTVAALEQGQADGYHVGTLLHVSVAGRGTATIARGLA